ncbi:MAG: DsbE family thiol:disulfide interchange protein [Pseudomonadota bacterium]
MRYALPLIVFALLSILLMVGIGKDPTRIPSPLLDQPVPQFALETLSQPAVAVSDQDLRGEPALLNVWGSWCVNCAREHDFLMQVAQQMPVYGLNWNDEPEAARQWLSRLGDPFTFSAHDVDGRVAIDLGVYGAPETFLLDGNGTIVFKHVGELNPEVWAREFEPRIAQLNQ